MKKTILRKVILSILNIILFINLEIKAQTGTAGLGNPLLDLGYGARAVGMGGAFVGVADDGNAGYWNPAGLSQLRQIEITSMYTSLFFGTKFFYFSLSVPLKKLAKLGKSTNNSNNKKYKFAGDKELDNSKWGGISIGWVESFISGIKSTSEIMDPVTGKPFTYYGDFNIRENAVLLAYGINLFEFLAVGLNSKLILKDYHINDIFGWGIGFDGGLMVKPVRNLRIGIVYQDMGETTLFWSQVVGGIKEDSKERIRSRLKVGASFDLKDLFYSKGKKNKVSPNKRLNQESNTRFTSGLILSTEFRSMIAKKQPVSWHVGMEWNILDTLFIRFGFDDLNVTAGAGLGYKIVYFDYSFVHHPYLESTHRISFSLKI